MLPVDSTPTTDGVKVPGPVLPRDARAGHTSVPRRPRTQPHKRHQAARKTAWNATYHVHDDALHANKELLKRDAPLLGPAQLRGREVHDLPDDWPNEFQAVAPLEAGCTGRSLPVPAFSGTGGRAGPLPAILRAGVPLRTAAYRFLPLPPPTPTAHPRRLLRTCSNKWSASVLEVLRPHTCSSKAAGARCAKRSGQVAKPAELSRPCPRAQLNLRIESFP